jgi:hypothetical protein
MFELLHHTQALWHTTWPGVTITQISDQGNSDPTFSVGAMMKSGAWYASLSMNLVECPSAPRQIKNWLGEGRCAQMKDLSALCPHREIDKADARVNAGIICASIEKLTEALAWKCRNYGANFSGSNAQAVANGWTSGADTSHSMGSGVGMFGNSVR